MTATIIQERADRLAELPPLKSGSHPDSEWAEGAHCVMERVAWLVGDTATDHPDTACPVLTSFCIRWNDRLRSDADRDRILGPFAVRLALSKATPEIEAERRKMLRTWAYEYALPRTLDMAGLTEQAEAVRAKPGDRDTIYEARKAAVAKRDEAYGGDYWAWRKKLRAKVTAAVKEKLAEKPAVAAAAAAVADAADAAADAAVAAAVAAAAADAVVADAVVADAAAAVADAAADAVVADAVAAVADVAAAAVVAAAVADAAADADAAAVAAAVADAAAADWSYGGANYWKVRNAVYEAIVGKFRDAFDADPKRKELRMDLEGSAVNLLDSMLKLGEEAA